MNATVDGMADTWANATYNLVLTLRSARDQTIPATDHIVCYIFSMQHPASSGKGIELNLYIAGMQHDIRYSRGEGDERSTRPTTEFHAIARRATRLYDRNGAHPGPGRAGFVDRSTFLDFDTSPSHAIERKQPERSFSCVD